jgi:hypothetical protein
MIVRHGLCEDRTDVKIDRSTAPVSRMMVSSIALPPLLPLRFVAPLAMDAASSAD